MTPSSGPPISTSFLMRRKFPLHAEEVKRKNLLLFLFTLTRHRTAVTGTHFITFHVFVRSVAIKQRQKAVAFQVAGPVVRVCGGKTYIYVGCVSLAGCAGSLKSLQNSFLILTVPVVADRHFLSKSVVANTVHCLLYAFRKYPRQVVCVCGIRWWEIHCITNNLEDKVI